MISKKMRNISMVCLSLVLALTLAFGLSSFSNIKKADAADTSFASKSASQNIAASVGDFYFLRSGGNVSSNSKGVEVKNDLIILMKLTGNSNISITVQASSSNKSGDLNVFTVDEEFFNLFADSAKNNTEYTTYTANSTKYSGYTVKKESEYFTSKELSVKSASSGSNYEATSEASSFSAGYYAMIAPTSVSGLYINKITTTALTKTFTVSFNANGGKGTMSNQTFTENVAANLTSNTFERTGYNFLGWSTDKDATEATYTDAQSVTIAADTELFAVWEENQNFTFVTFDAIESISKGYVEVGGDVSKLNLPTTITANNGEKSYEVTGWEGTLPALGETATFTATYVLGENEALAAGASEPTVTVTLTDDRKVVTSVESVEKTVNKGDDVTLPTQLKAVLDDGSMVDADVTWDEFNTDTVGTTTVNGNLNPSLYNTENVTIKANINVLAGANVAGLVDYTVYIVNNNAVEVNTTVIDSTTGISYTIGSKITSNENGYLATGGRTNSTEREISFTIPNGVKATVSIDVYTNSNGKERSGFVSKSLSDDTNNAINSIVAASTASYGNGDPATATYNDLESGTYYVCADASVNFSKIAITTQIGEAAPTKEGYTFVGYVDANGDFAEEGTAVFGKVEYLGISFRTTGSAGVRYGFGAKFVDENDNEVAISADKITGHKFVTKTRFASSIQTNAANVTVVTEIKTGSELYSGICFNLVITGLNNTYLNTDISVNAQFTVNNVTLISANDFATINSYVKQAVEVDKILDADFAKDNYGYSAE